MFVHMNPIFYLFMAPGLLLAIWAQFKVRSAFQEGKQVPASSGLTGAQAAAAVMHDAGVTGVGIEPAQGFLSDHYDPRHKVLRLSPDVYSGRSLATLGVAAHEAGHALQDARNYAPLAFRNAIVPVANFGSSFGFIIIIAGLFMSMAGLMMLGIIVFSATVVFQLVNLPVEFDASRRARSLLLANGLVTQGEDEVVGRVLNAAALTYVAATVSSVLTLAYYLLHALALGGRDE